MQMSQVIAGAALLLVSAGLAGDAQQQPAPAPAAAFHQAAAMGGNVEHGRYLVEEVAMCVQCHSPRDEEGNIVESQKFTGAPIPFRPPWQNDWAIFAPRNRTLPGYDDQQAMRLLTQGAIGRDGKQLRAPMPRFHMTNQDAADVIAYMRSLQ
jgi:mono/diheme cytochrome c family protein